MLATILVLMLLGSSTPPGAPVVLDPNKPAALKETELSLTVRKRILDTMFKDEEYEGDDREEILEQSTVERKRLGPGVRISLIVRGGGLLCGATGNCPIWIFDPRGGELLLEAGGDDMKLKSAIHEGMYDLEFPWNYSYCDGDIAHYRFDGKRYRLVWRRHYGCQR
jgi:hypothetical protein